MKKNNYEILAGICLNGLKLLEIAGIGHFFLLCPNTILKFAQNQKKRMFASCNRHFSLPN